MIQWDMWQFKNQVLHSLTGPTSIASHHSLNYQINEEKFTGTDSINKSNYHLFSRLYTITKLHSSSTQDKKLWLKIVHLARKDYEEPNCEIIRQDTSMGNQMKIFLITNILLSPVLPRQRLVATQDNFISIEKT